MLPRLLVPLLLAVSTLSNGSPDEVAPPAAVVAPWGTRNASFQSAPLSLNTSALNRTLLLLDQLANSLNTAVVVADGGTAAGGGRGAEGNTDRSPIAAKLHAEGVILALKCRSLANLGRGGSDFLATALPPQPSAPPSPAVAAQQDQWQEQPQQRHRLQGLLSPRVPKETSQAVSTMFDSARTVASVIHQHAPRELLLGFLASVNAAVRQDVVAAAARAAAATAATSATRAHTRRQGDVFPDGGLGSVHTAAAAATAAATAAVAASSVNRQLAELHWQYHDFAPARQLLADVVRSQVHAPGLSSTAADTDEYAAVMYAYGQLVSGVGVKGLSPPAEEVLNGKQHIFVALEAYRATLNPRYAAILEELAGEHVSRGLNATTLPIVVQYFTLALEYLAAPGVNMTGTANYNAILGQYYLAAATLELEQHYHLLRTLREGGGPSGRRRRVWSHAQLTRSGVQHAKLEAVKSLARVQRRYFAAVRHFRTQDLAPMAPDYQYDTASTFRMCFVEVCKQASQIAKTLDVVVQLEEARSEPAVRGVVPHEIGAVSGRGGAVFELDSTEPLVAGAGGGGGGRPEAGTVAATATATAAAAAAAASTDAAVIASVGGPVKSTVRALLQTASATMAEIESVSNATVALLSRRPAAAVHKRVGAALGEGGGGEHDGSEDPGEGGGSSSIEAGHLPNELWLQLLQDGFREQFVDNYHRYVIPTTQRLRFLRRSYSWLGDAGAGNAGGHAEEAGPHQAPR